MKLLRHWETHLYTYAVSYANRARIVPENLAKIRKKAINHGHTEAQCLAVETDTSRFIILGELSK